MKLKRKIELILGIILLLIMIFSVRVEAASVSISASNTSVEVGTTVTINVNVTAASYNLYVEGDGISRTSFVDFSQDAVNENFTESVSFTPETAGTYTINLTGTVVDETQTEGDSVNKSVTITVKEKETSSGGGSDSGSGSNQGSSGNSGSSSNSGSSGSSGSSSGSSGSGSSSSSTPSFTEVNETVYATGSVNVRQSWSTSSSVVGSLSEGQSVTRTGKGSNGWSRVTFNGSTAYVSSQYLTTEKPEDKSKNSALKELTLLQGTLTPEFSKDITEYTVQVGTDVTELQLDAIPEDEKAKVKVDGNTDLKDGENKVTITVTAEDESTTVYTLTVNKTDETKDVGPVLSKLEISGATLSPTFSPEVYSYSVNVPIGTTTLDITAEAEDEETTVEITGNTDLKEGENLVTIMVTKGEGEEQQVTTYQITVNVGDLLATSGENSSSSSGLNILVIICGIAAAIIVIAIITLIVINRRNKMDYDDDEDEDEDYANTTMLNQNFNYADELKARRAEKDEEKKQSREDYLNSYKDIADNSTTENSNENDDNDDDTTDRKKRRGRHF